MDRQPKIIHDEYRKEYAEFIDLAVHELDAPLRKVLVWFDRLNEKGSIDEAGMSYVPRIKGCLDEMRTLISTLSNLSEYSTGISENSNCNIPEIINRLVQKHTLTEPKWKPVISAILTVEGDPAQLEILFRNLIENAYKFSRKDVPVKIEIGSHPFSIEEVREHDLDEDVKYSRITVKDNGIGFDPKFSRQIFTPFVRLNGKSEYPGSGIGLAICKKIMENHQGTIYAEGNENEGSSFILVFPQRLY